MRLSVVLPSLDGAATIGLQLGALASQSWAEPWELIVSDNGSRDGTLAIVEGYRGRIPALRVVDASARRSVGYACNVGVAAAAGEALAFCNDDDEVAEGWVAAMGTALAEHEFVGGRLEHEKLNEPWLIAVRGRAQADGFSEWALGGHLPFAFGCALGIRRALHDAIGGFDEDLFSGEDMDYCWRAQYAGAELRFVPDAVTHYRHRPGLGGLYRQGRSYGIGTVAVYAKHRGLGLPPLPHPWRRGLRAWLGIGKQLLTAGNRVGLGRFLWHLGWRAGLARGSIRARVVCL
jgi:GT2 family glycosyltransferase